jgi:DmsE family decaheme c-type cytochrome
MTTRSKKVYLWLLSFPLFLIGTSVALAQSQPGAAESPLLSGQAAVGTQTDTSKFSGVETCLHCHNSAGGQITRTAHADTSQWRAANALAKTGVTTTCEGCHGSGKAHAEAELEAERTETKNPAAKKLIFDFDLKTSSAESINKRCLTCHASGPNHLNSSNSFHRQNDVSCVNCHSPHHASTQEKLLVKTQPELCYTCHSQQKAQFNMPFRHRVDEGLIQCTDCHNQHGTGGIWESDHLVRQVRTSSSGSFVCFKCHADKQGPFVFEHAAVKTEGCAACHTPHGGPNPHMLKQSNVGLLCLSCHTAAAFGHTPAMDPMMSDQQNSCPLCHVQIHGSNFNNDLLR